MAHPDVTSKERAWHEQCVRLVQQRVPDVSRQDAEKCADEIARTWPALRPEEAVERYFEGPSFQPTDWGFFELK